MLSIFKSKPKLHELIPTNYVDIHSHVLPGIDDGAKSIEDSAFLIKSMREFGFQKIITTPHTYKSFWDNTPQTIKEAKEKVQHNLPELCSAVQLTAASEYYLDDHFVTLIQNGTLLPLKENYVLVELSYLNAPLQLFEILFEMQLKGYQPVLAHPERYVFYHRQFTSYNQLKKAGCLFQMNLLAAVGYYGKEVTAAADQLLKQGFYDYVGSDIHHQNHISAFNRKILLKNKTAFEEAIAGNSFFK